MSAQYKYIVDLLLKDEKFLKSIANTSTKLRETEKRSASLNGSFTKLAGTLGLAFSVKQLYDFGKECVLLAAKAEGIHAAFKKLYDPSLLNNLRQATRNTVSDIELMTAAVQARNFSIPLEKLPTYFEFATARALETGQSIDYLVESLVNGIGRKSVLILDNLGLSIVDINEELQKTGDFAAAVNNVIQREMERTGNVVDTSTVKIQSMSASWANFKEQLGSTLLKLGIGEVLETSTRRMKMFQAENLSFWQKLGMHTVAVFGRYEGFITKWEERTQEAMDNISKMTEEQVYAEIAMYNPWSDDKWTAWYAELLRARLADIQKTKEQSAAETEHARTISAINDEIKMYKELLENTNVADGKSLQFHTQKIAALEKELEAVRKLARGSGGPEVSSIDMSGTVLPSFAVSTSAGLQTAAAEMDMLTSKVHALMQAYGFLEGVENPVEAVANLMNEIKPESMYDKLLDSVYALRMEFKAFEDTLSQGADSFGEYANKMGGAARQLISAALGEAVATSISAMLKGNSKLIAMAGPAGPAVIAAISALASGAARTAFNSLIPAFASGAVISGPTLGLIGEYPGAKSDPEVVAPLSKLQTLMQPPGMGGTVKFVLDGRVFVGYLEQENRYKRNIRGN